MYRRRCGAERRGAKSSAFTLGWVAMMYVSDGHSNKVLVTSCVRAEADCIDGMSFGSALRLHDN